MELQQSSQQAVPPAPQAPRNANVLRVKIISAEQTLYHKDAKAVSSLNATGSFDVLPYHANFISIVLQKAVVHELDGTEREFPFEIAVLKVLDGEVDIFLGIERADFITWDGKKSENPEVSAKDAAVV